MNENNRPAKQLTNEWIKGNENTWAHALASWNAWI